MVHRLQNRSFGNTNSASTTPTSNNNQATINATEGATALELNNLVNKENEQIPEKDINQQEVKLEPTIDPLLNNISIENATYLQSTQEVDNNFPNWSDTESEKPNFEVDSIELASPQLFDQDSEFIDNSNNEKNLLGIFENSQNGENSKKSKVSERDTQIIKEPEMFEEPNLEEDFEIPAFLRKQKN